MAVPAFAAHDNSASIFPEWSVAGEEIHYTVTICNVPDGNDSIDEVRLYEASDYNITNAQDELGWFKSPFNPVKKYYQYTAETAGNYINAGFCNGFEFNALTPSQEKCNIQWKFETRDVTNVWKFAYDTTSIDDTAPELTKEVIGPQDGPCPPRKGEECWINYDTSINVNVADPPAGDCDPSGLDYCKITYTLDGGDPITEVYDDLKGETSWDYSVSFDEDSVHVLTVECKDRAGNLLTDTETFRVDNTPPETTKTYGVPHFPDPIVENQYPHWITTSTPITLTSVDPDPTRYQCNIGVDETYYRNVFQGPGNLDRYCQSYEACQTWESASPGDKEANWTLYTEPFYKTEESCHIIEYYSVDELGNTEPTKWQCVYVDTTPPEVWKVHDEGMIKDENPGLGVFHWMTKEMPIDLYCTDTGAHPVDNVNLWYRTWDDISGEWSEWIDSIAVESHKRVYFTEDSVHKLQYYCEDALGNSTGTEKDPLEQTYRVDSTPPQISKDMFGSWLGDCPIGTDLEHGNCFVADNGTSGVDVTVIDPDPTTFGCNVDKVECSYQVWWNATIEECNDADGLGHDKEWRLLDKGDFSETQHIVFTEDSTHKLIIECEDALANKVEDTEYFLVDSTPPVTTKEYGAPYVVDPSCAKGNGIYCSGFWETAGFENEDACTNYYNHKNCTWWITSQSLVTLTAEDEKSGVDTIYWRNLWFPNNDKICNVSTVIPRGAVAPQNFCNPDYYSTFVDVWPEFDVYDGPFYKPKESCHVIEFYSVDKLGNEESLNWQCPFVDNSPPVGIKTVGEPKLVCEAPEGTNQNGGCDGFRTYTFDSDFDEGILFNLEHNTTHDQLQLSMEAATTYPIMWIANAGEDSISKWDTENNKELARYHTWFGPLANHGEWSGPAPSRTAVDAEGNVYVANRHFDGKPADVFKILADDWIDRNGNGIMDTSIDSSNNGAIEPTEMLQMIDNNPANGIIDPAEISDERVAWVTRVGTNNCLGRSLAIDLQGNIWLGCFNEQAYYKLDGQTGAIIDGPISTPGHTPYGSLVDKHGILWGASLGSTMLRLDTTNNNVTVLNHSAYGSNYGIALGYDASDNTHIYLAEYSYGRTYIEYNSGTATFSNPASLLFYALGIATDIEGNIVVGNSYSGGVAKFTPEGNLIWDAVPQLSSEARGVVVDSGNDIWVIYRAASKMGKYKGSNGSHLGLFNTGRGPYTYSDATGLGFRGSVAQGTWNVIYDSGAPASVLGPVSWNADIPQGTEFTVKVRSSEDQITWSSWETVSNGVGFVSTPNARYLEVQVSMKGTQEFSPVLYDLTVNGGCGTTPVEDCWFVTQNTPITFNCNDVEPHPVSNETAWWRFSFYPEGFNGPVEYSDWSNTPIGTTVQFKEDSWHDLEFYCTDGLENQNTTDREFFIVDTAPPIITKTVVGPQIGECPPIKDGDECIIDGITEIHVDAVDPQPHPVNMVSCDWSYEVIGTDITGGAQGVQVPFIINFPEESRHALTITCRDGLGNTTRDYEEFIVDKTPPITTKKYGTPFYEEKGKEWITTKTPITLTVEDAGPHQTGIKETKYRINRVADGYCNPENQELNCQDAVGTGNFLDYIEAFHANEESCHLIEYYSIDNVNKTEQTKKQCTYVDTTPPDPVKTVGEPKDVWDGLDSAYYDLADFCSVEGNCWKVTMLTPITLDCVDPAPHPVDHSTTYFKVELDGDDVTADYCNRYNGNFNANDDGFCQLARGETQFFFGEESEHNLAYYCEDALGNTGPVDDEKFKVEGTSFTIHLNKKWNLVSVPFVLINDAPEEVFDDIQESVESIWTFDSFENKWYVYHPNGAPGTSNLEAITPGWGYWIRAYNEDDLIIGGSLFSPATLPPSRNLKAGFNLVGYYGADGETGYFRPQGNGKQADCVFYSLKQYFPGEIPFSSLFSYWQPYNEDGDPNTSVWLEFNKSNYLDPGAGYWVLIPKDGIYAYTTECGYN